MPASCPQCSREFEEGTSACPDDGAVLIQGADWQEKTHARFQSVQTEAIPAEAMGFSEPTVSVLDELRPLTGRTLGDYVVGEKLGTGGMGEVYLADQPVIGKKVAIKFLKKEYAADPDCVNRMLTEARAVSAIRHRGIIDIYNFGTLPDGRPYLVMEYLVGEPLDALLHRSGSLNQPEVVDLLEDICTTLAAAHGAGVIHRDLKPANIFLLTDPTSGARYVKLLDFGLAKAQRLAASGPSTRVGMAMGTPDYMSPEQARGVTVTAQTDLYAVGAMAYELLTGKVPFTAPSVMDLLIMHLRVPAPRVSSQLGTVSPELDELVWRMMAKTPEARPESADAVRRELKRIRLSLREQKTQIVGRTGAVPQPTDRPRRSSSRSVPRAPAPVEAPVVAAPPASSAPGVGVFVLLGLVIVLLTALLLITWKTPQVEPVAATDVPVVAEPVVPVPVPVPAVAQVEPKPEPVAEVKPAPTPEQVEPPPPEPAPKVAPVRAPVAVKKAAPTQGELSKALERALAQPRSTRMSERLISEKTKVLRQAIDTAKTPALRLASLAQIREFERQLTRGR